MKTTKVILDEFVEETIAKFGSATAALDLLAEEGEAEERFVKRLRYAASVVEGSPYDQDTLALRMLGYGAEQMTRH